MASGVLYRRVSAVLGAGFDSQKYPLYDGRAGSLLTKPRHTNPRFTTQSPRRTGTQLARCARARMGLGGLEPRHTRALQQAEEENW